MPPLLGRRAAAVGVAAALLAPAMGRGAETNGVIVGRDGWLFAGWEGIRRSDPVMIGRVADTLNAGIALMKQAGLQIAISLTPGKARIYKEYLPEDVKWSPDADRRYDLVMKMLRRSGALVPDQATMFGALRQQHAEVAYWFKADTHWTATGAEQSARLMAAEVKQAVPLPAATRPGVQLGPPVDALQERNDLAALLPVPQQAAYPYQHYMARKPISAGGGALLDEDTADVLVIGNSYMQPAYGYANVLSDQLGRPDALYWKVHQQSLYFTMLAYLKSDSFKKQRPKLVVWNMAEDDFEVNSNNPGAWGQTAMPAPAFLADLKQALAV